MIDRLVSKAFRLLLIVAALSVGLSYLASRVGGEAGPVLKTAPPYHDTEVFAGVVGSVIGSIIGVLLLICFVIGVSARLVGWFRRAISDDGTTGRGQRRNVSRDWADDVPVIRRRLTRNEPVHPSFNGRR